MSGEDVARKNKATMAYLIRELHGRRRMEVLDDVFAEDWIDHFIEELRPGQDSSREGLRQLVLRGFTTFPDRRTVVEDMIAEGDKVVVRSYVTGTHTGDDYLGMPATGKTIINRMIVVHRFKDRKIVESWGGFDEFGVLQQMGVLKVERPA